MLGKEFRSLAEAVTRTYGDNPWFFLRELAQNSRDAGATRIHVRAETTADGFEVLTFADNGRGMDRHHAQRFLFRLYASDKTDDRSSAGKYGIGFWTILGFRPGQVLIQSRRRDDGWGIALNAELEHRPAPCTLERPGTVIVLSRKAVFPESGEFIRVVDRELRAHCQFLRRNDFRGSMLPVFFHDRNITIPISLPGPLSLSFHDGSVEGAVGLGETPLVRLYARGLPVWEGAVLSQMSHLQHQADIQGEIGRGLAPVFLLNGNRLDVTFSRNLVQENRAMEKVRKTAERALRRLLADAMENAFPRRWAQRLADRARELAGRVRRPRWKLLPLLLLFILPLEILLLSLFFPLRRESGPSAFDLNSASLQYRGATVGGSISGPGSPLAYFPPLALWFKVFAAADYDTRSGFVRQAGKAFAPPGPIPPCDPEKTVSMRFFVARAGRVFLPLPPGHALASAGIILDQQESVLSVAVNELGEFSALVPQSGATVFYRSCPHAHERTLSAAEKERLTRLPDDLYWPEDLERGLAEARSLPPEKKVALASALVRARIRFDVSEATARAYRRASGGQAWLARVLAIGKGDCDVINGVQALLLRKMGVPARLAIGLVGSGGRMTPGLHAWCEYYDASWHVADASSESGGAGAPLPADEIEAARGHHSDGAREGRPFLHQTPLLFIVLPVLAVLLAASAWTIRKKKGSRSAAGPAAAAATRELLLPVIRQALLCPAVWGKHGPLWDHRFLPVIQGRPMSVRRAMALLHKRRLLLTTTRSPLALAMGNGRRPILDLSREGFAPLFPLFAGAVQLDLLWQLRPQPPTGTADARGDLLAAVNAVLAERRSGRACCLLAPGLKEDDFMDVRLPAAPRRLGIFFPRRFIAVNPSAGALAESTALIERNRPLAIFRFFQALQARSLLPAADPQTFMRKAARRLLQGNP
jgi:hypothetical protein